MTNRSPLRVLVIGAKDHSEQLEKVVATAGLEDTLAIVGQAGRISRVVLNRLTQADVAIVVVPRGSGFSAETRRECLLAWSVGAVPVLAVESIGRRDQAEVRSTGEAFAAWAHRLGLVPAIWLSLTPDGGHAVEALGRLALANRAAEPFRLWVDTASHMDAVTRLTGTPTGSIAPGDPVVVLPQGVSATIARSEAERLDRLADAIVLDGHFDIAPGSLVVAANERPELSDQVAAHLVWVDERPMLPGRSYQLYLGPQRSSATVTLLKHRLNPSDLDPIAARQLADGEAGLVNLSFSTPVFSDPFERSAALGRFTLHEQGRDVPVGYGRIAFTLRRATNIHWQALAVDKTARAALKGQRPCCLWLTGLSGSGKSTVASLLEQRLNAAGRHTYTLDGDNVRHGLNRDLGFTDADRVENIRRVAEVARLFVDAGLIVIVSFISPFRAERRMARDLFPPGDFIEIFVDTPLEECERRDAKGLYKKARAGLLKNFTGIDSPYEPPESPELHLHGLTSTPEEMVDKVLRELERRSMI